LQDQIFPFQILEEENQPQRGAKDSKEPIGARVFETTVFNRKGKKEKELD
jgi:hypothetical protein